MTEEARQIRWLRDRTEIIDLVVRFANAFDSQDWNTLRSCLTETVETDYSQFRGEAPAQESADAYVASRREGLSGLRTLHISTNHSVTVSGDEAVCQSAYRIYRLDPEREEGENRLDTAGSYEHGLVRTAQGWRIRSIRQEVLLREGNPHLHGALRKKLSVTDRAG